MLKYTRTIYQPVDLMAVQIKAVHMAVACQIDNRQLPAAYRAKMMQRGTMTEINTVKHGINQFHQINKRLANILIILIILIIRKILVIRIDGLHQNAQTT